MSALPGASLYILFPGFGPHRSHISKTRALYMYFGLENVGRKGPFFFFWQLQPIKHMVTRSKTHVIRMGKLPYRRIDLVNVSPSGSGKRLPGPAVNKCSSDHDDEHTVFGYSFPSRAETVSFLWLWSMMAPWRRPWVSSANGKCYSKK